MGSSQTKGIQMVSLRKISIVLWYRIINSYIGALGKNKIKNYFTPILEYTIVNSIQFVVQVDSSVNQDKEEYKMVAGINILITKTLMSKTFIESFL